MRTPIQTWPTKRYRGKPNYSAAHFRMLAGAENDPLRVAERIAARVDAERVGVEVEAKLAAGVDYSEISRWQSQELTKVRAARWEELCASFDKVIEVLEQDMIRNPASAKGLKRILSEAKRAKKHARTT